MKIVLAGNSAVLNGSHEFDQIKNILSEEAFECVMADSPAAARAMAKDLPVILLNRSIVDPFLTNNAYAEKAVAKLSAKDPVVLLLDREKDSPDYIYQTVLNRASSIAAGKRPVIVLARSMRSGSAEMESRYAEARNLGVTFSKYAHISFDNLIDSYELTVYDDFHSYTLKTPLLIDCTLTESEETDAFAKALQLHLYGNDLINADRWFLAPGRTSRRGVYFIDTALILSGSLEKTVRSIADEVKRMADRKPDSYAHVDPHKCAFCYTCYRVCPHAALEPDSEAAAMKVVEPLCDACGMCAAICPANAIRMYGQAQESDKVSPFHLGQAEKEQIGNQILAICCENSAAIAANGALLGLNAATVSVPCGGNINAELISSALQTFGQVLVAVCPDEACKHFDGSKRACLQTEKVILTMKRLGLDPQRVRFVQISHASPLVLRDLVTTTADTAVPH